MLMQPEERLGLHIKRVEQELMAAKHAVLRPFGLTVPQYVALYMLAERTGISAAALARLCLVTPQTIATVLANLETKALITRKPHPWHRKVVEVKLTDAGHELLAQADEKVAAIERKLADAYAPDERAQLIELLTRGSNRLGDLDHALATNREVEMDDAKTREHIRQHAEAVVRGDMDTIVADFSEELRPQVPQLAEGLPQPVTAAEVLRLDIEDAESVATIRYSGDSGDVTLRTRWHDATDHPVIVHVEPVT